MILILDTLVRFAMTTEFEYGVKLILALLSRVLTSVNANPNMGPGQQDRSRDLLFIICDILSYRLIGYPLPVSARVRSSYSNLSWTI